MAIFGPQGAYILSAYCVAFTLLIGMTGFSILKAYRARSRLAQLSEISALRQEAD